MTEDFLRVLISLGVLFFGSGMMLTDVPARPASQNVDLLIRHGKLIDGSGGPPRVGDLGIRGDRIVFIGDAAKDGITAARFIDASGLDVAPGFIHPHTHTLDDLTSAQRHVNIAYLMQGVTTVITGNDGSSPLPIGERFASTY